MATVPINLNSLMPQFVRTIPINQPVAETAVQVDLSIFQGANANLPPIEFDRIVERKGKERFAPKPYTLVELQAFARAWGITKPATNKPDLVSQMRAEYRRRYPQSHQGED